MRGKRNTEREKQKIRGKTRNQQMNCLLIRVLPELRPGFEQIAAEEEKKRHVEKVDEVADMLQKTIRRKLQMQQDMSENNKKNSYSLAAVHPCQPRRNAGAGSCTQRGNPLLQLIRHIGKTWGTTWPAFKPWDGGLRVRVGRINAFSLSSVSWARLLT